MTIYVTATMAAWARIKKSGEAKAPPPGSTTESDGRYGSETVVPSPSELMVNTPVAVFAV
jgi:hypothetical protein